jgi:hypothetical protein
VAIKERGGILGLVVLAEFGEIKRYQEPLFALNL